MSLKPAALESPHLQEGRPGLNDPEIQVLHTPMDLPAMQSRWEPVSDPPTDSHNENHS